MSTDWLPTKQADILAMAKTWIEVLTEGNRWEDWDFLESEFQELKRLYAEARFAFDQNNSASRGPVTAEALRRTLAALTAHMRWIRQRRLFSPPLTSDDLISLKLRPRDNTRTEHFTVPELVDFVIHVHEARQLVVDFWIMGAANKAKPPMYDGAVIIWGILDAEPANNEQLTHHTMASKTPHTLSFSPEERGKTVWMALAWQNERGNTGNWSNYQSAIVP